MKKTKNLFKTILLLLALQLCCGNSLMAQALPTTVLFQNSSQLYKNIRKPNGVYLDALALNGAPDKPAGIAAAGVGLIYLCMSDAMLIKTGDSGNWQDTDARVIQTLDAFIGFRTAGKTNGAGMFPRYFNFQTGNQQGDWSYEYSTMDNAIFAMGLIMCKNYFANTTIDNKVTSLLSTMDYTKAIQPTQIALVFDQSGNNGLSFTNPFNEYMLVAWLAKNAKTTNAGYTKSQTFWNKYFANPLTAPAPVTRPNYFGVATLSDGAGWQSSFVPQFCYYFVRNFKNNANYMSYFSDWLTIDKNYCANAGATNTNEWGLGAGEIPGGGYSADKVESNPDKIVSPHIIAGFIPINASNSKATLTYLYNNNKGIYTLPGTTRKVLWRYKRENPAQKANYIQAIDYSTMLFGLAALPEHLGINWFSNYNNPVNSGLKRESTIELTENISQEISVYPNPFVDAINILGAKNVGATIKIFDTTGKLMFLSKMSDIAQTIDLSKEFAPGIYILELNTNEEYSRVKIVRK
ncbi:T9SS type A sorting domain-containing protein [Flavobacterium sp.]|uniref:T9SS type A sorting domain-containing protein n=1 Tax=Flavobacterium sp. TaxID=239 RepID=UPI00286E063A|nr:T9SS type A sorting domain-containing protein [Flavobacterium sp.]